MNSIWYRIVLLVFLLTLILAPFAGFAPLLLIILFAGVYWFVVSIGQILIFGDPDTKSSSKNIVEEK